MNDATTNDVIEADDDFEIPEGFEMPEGFTDDDFKALLPTEREAIIQGDTPPEPEAAQKAAEPAPAPEPEPAQLPEVPDTTQAEADLKAIDGKRDALLDSYDDGELTRAEFNEQMNKLNAEAVTSEATIANAKNAQAERERIEREQQEAAKAQNDQTWAAAVDRAREADAVLFAKENIDAFDEHVKEMAVLDGAANMAVDAFLAFCGQTFRQRQAAMGKPLAGEPKPVAKQGKGTTRTSQEAPEDDGDDDLAPTSLAFVPSAATNGGETDGRFQHLQNLAVTDTHAFEAAAAQLSDADMRRFEEWVG